MVHVDFRSLLQDETVVRWKLLDDEADPCAVLTSRMELLYLNVPCQALVPHDWFAKRCFEMLPTSDSLCALDCPTILAVQTSNEIVYLEECLELDNESAVNLGTAVIPLRESKDNAAKAILLFRLRAREANDATFKAQLLSDAHVLSERVQHTNR